jgi:hypothetical protein
MMHVTRDVQTSSQLLRVVHPLSSSEATMTPSLFSFVNLLTAQRLKLTLTLEHVGAGASKDLRYVHILPNGVLRPFWDSNGFLKELVEVVLSTCHALLVEITVNTSRLGYSS